MTTVHTTSHSAPARSFRRTLTQRLTLAAAMASLGASLAVSPVWAQDGAPAAPPAKPAAPASPAAPAAPAKPGQSGNGAAPAAPAAPAARPRTPTPKPLEVDPAKIPSAQEVFKRHYEAVGGDAAWKSRTSMSSTGSMVIPAAGIEAPMTVKSLVPNKLAVSLELPQQGSTRMGYDGTTAWSIDPMRGPTLMSPDQLGDFKRTADFQRDSRLAANPGKSTVTGLAEFDGRTVWVVKVVEDGSDEAGTTQMYDRDSGLLVGMSTIAKTEMGDIPVTVVLAEYGDFDGAKAPKRTIMWMMMQSMDMLVKSIEWNTLKDSDFAVPPEIATLMKARDEKKADAPAGDAKPAGDGKPAGNGKPAGETAPKKPGNGAGTSAPKGS